MKKLILLAIFFLGMIAQETFGQTRYGWANPIPDSMTWNLDQSVKEDFILSPPSGQGDIPLESSIWQKPEKDKMTVKIVAVRPADLGFGLGYDHSEFILAAKKLGYLHCPEWVPIQAYMSFGRSKGHIFFYTGEAKKYWCFGLYGYKSQDLWKRTLDGRPDSIWIFVRE
ncbi:MAG: hypothetical protein QG580_110 [Patescibacteria group bacterium]|jgi:hypothetical protein|nr:hypothetical protein [Patescibacteria group bacterium]